MSVFREEQQSPPVVVTVADSSTRAEFIRITLAANGIDAMVSPSSSAYPSVDFVQGVEVLVRRDQEGEARELVRRLGLDRGDPGAGDPA